MATVIDIPHPEKVFTPVYKCLVQADTRFVVNYGGTASSKSFSAAQKEVLVAAIKPVKTLVIRKVANTLRDSVIPSFLRRIDEFDMVDLFKYNKSDRQITCLETGSEIIFRGLDDSEKMKSIEGLNRIMIEEASELVLDDFMETNRRVRGVLKPQITLNFNPIHEMHWLKKRFFDNNHDTDITIIHSTYFDNPFLTEDDRKQIELMKEYDYNQYRIYALGEWGITGNDNPWLFSFKESKHIGYVSFMPTYPVYLSFDFNREPVSCLAVQMSPNYGHEDSFVHFLNEFAENVQLEELCQRIKTAYPVSILFVTGDASGSHGDIGFTERHATYYKMIQRYLNLSDRQMNLNSKNLGHNDSRNLCNLMLHQYPSLKIHPDCKLLRADIAKATVDDTKALPGILKKDRKEYKMDVMDCFRYFFQTYFLSFVQQAYMSKVPKE